MPPGTPHHNGVSDRHNRTLLDIVQSMMSLTDLPLSFWGYALETTAFTLKRAPSKSVETTQSELWFGKKPKLSFLKVLGCDAYVKKFHPDKLKPKSEKYVFIGYPKETVGYTFYVRTPTQCHIDLVCNTSYHFAASRTVFPRVSPYLCPGPFASFGTRI